MVVSQQPQKRSKEVPHAKAIGSETDVRVESTVRSNRSYNVTAK